MFCCVVLCCVVLHFVVLCCVVVFYCIVLYCVVLYCVVLYCIVLYCVVLCCVVHQLYCVVLCFYTFAKNRKVEYLVFYIHRTPLALRCDISMSLDGFVHSEPLWWLVDCFLRLCFCPYLHWNSKKRWKSTMLNIVYNLLLKDWRQNILFTGFLPVWVIYICLQDLLWENILGKTSLKFKIFCQNKITRVVYWVFFINFIRPVAI